MNKLTWKQSKWMLQLILISWVTFIATELIGAFLKLCASWTLDSPHCLLLGGRFLWDPWVSPGSFLIIPKHSEPFLKLWICFPLMQPQTKVLKGSSLPHSAPDPPLDSGVWRAVFSIPGPVKAPGEAFKNMHAQAQAQARSQRFSFNSYGMCLGISIF